MGRLGAILLAIILLVPTGVQAEWVMFGGDANHSGIAEITERTIQKREPTVSWDRGSSSEEVYSWGTSIGNFTPNIDGDPYDRNVLHIVYVTAEQDGDWLRGYLVIRDGGNPGKLMWKRDLGNIKDQNNQSLESDFENFEAAYGAPAIADFDGDGLMDVAIVTPNGIVHFFEPEIEYTAQSESYDADDEGDRWSYETDMTVVRSNAAITSFSNNDDNDLVISGIDLDNGEIKVVAIDGSTGNDLWSFEADGTEVSSPAVLVDSGSRQIFVSVYDNTQLVVYAIQGGSGLSGWNPKTIGNILAPDDPGQHPMLPSILISDITDNTGKEILVPQPPDEDSGDSQLWLFTDDGNYANGWATSYTLEGGGEMDATPAAGDIDGDGDVEIVAVTWEDPSDWSDNEITHVWAIGNDRVVEWETEYNTDSSGGGDNDEHAVSSPILAVIYTEDGEDNLDVFTCTTPNCFALDGNDGSDGGGAKDHLWSVKLDDRDDDNRIFNSPAASDVDGDGLLDFVIDGAVYSADLADMTLKKSDIVITDSDGNLVTEVEETQELTLYPITIRNDGNHDALSVDIEVRLDSTTGKLLHEETIDIESNSIKNLEEFNWVAEGQGMHEIWVMCVVDEGENEEVRYDNNNASKSILVRPQYGLEVSIDDSSEMVDANQNANFVIDITNMGLRTDNYTISVTVMNPEWEITFPSVVSNVPSNTTANFTASFAPGVNVTASVHQFTVTATSEGNSSRFASVFVNIEVNQYYEIELVMPLSEQRVFPGTTLSYPVRITNQGNGDDTFDLYTTNDWNAQIRIDNSPSGSVTLGAFRTVEAELRITAPSDTSVGDYKEIAFTAISQGNDSVSESANSNTSIGIMMAEDAVIDILPGSQASFVIEFLNPGSDTDNLSISIFSGAPDWEYIISPTNVSLDSDEKGYSWINFTAPNTAEPGTTYTMVVDLSNNQTLDQISIVLEVKPIDGVRLWSVSGVHQVFANPGETVYFDVRVVNYESVTLDVDLSYNENIIEEWSVVYNNESTWSKSILAESSTTVSIGVTSPDDAEAVETGWLRITATTSGFADTYFDANITINQDFGIDIDSIGNTLLLGNVSQLITISLTNTGNGPDIFDISYDGSWVENTTTTLSFDAFETKEITFPVNSGLAIPGSQSLVMLTVNSSKSILAGSPVSATSDFLFSVTGMRAVDSQSIQLSQGESGTFNIAILSLIDSGAPNSRVITSVEGDVYWWTSFDDTEVFDNKETLIVPVGHPDIFSFTINVPEGAGSGNYAFTLKVTDYNEPSHVSTLNYNLFVRQEFDISVEAITVPSAVNPGDNAEWNLKITNNGNGGDRITLVLADLPENWNYSFASDSTFELPPGPPGDNVQSISFALSAPSYAPPDDYNFIVSAQSLGITVNLTLNLTLNTIFQVSAETSSTELIGQAGDTVYFAFNITNEGNSADTIQVTATGSMLLEATPNGFGWTSKTLEPNEIQNNYFKATIPQTNDGPWVVVVTIESSNPLASVVNLQFTLDGNVLLDATVRDLLFSPENLQDGDRVTARFTIAANNAHISSIYYSVYLDDKAVDGDFAYSIENGGSQVVKSTFVVPEGCHEVKVVLDPDTNIAESNPDNNEITSEICAKSSGGNNLPLFIGFFAVLLVGGAVYYRYSTRNRDPVIRTKTAPVVTESPVNFPLILNCTQCGSRVRVARPGSFRCPSCRSVSSVDSNGKIEAGEQDSGKNVTHVTQNINITDSVISKSNLGAEEIESSNTDRRRRMESFLTEESEEEPEEESEPERELSASEKLKKLKEGENAEEEPQETEEPAKKEKKTKKRRGPPKGGSFGPTVGGF